MKKLIFVLGRMYRLLTLQLFFVPLLSAQVNSDSVYQYFPMHVGNIWKYKTNALNERTFTITAEQGRSIPGIRFTIEESPSLRYSYTITLDSLIGDLHFVEGYNCIFDNVRVLPILSDTSVVVCDSVRTENIFGHSIPVRYIKTKLTINKSIVHHRSGWGIGTLSGDGNHILSTGEPFSLYYAFINGKHFGTALREREYDSLQQYFPHQVGDKWIYQRQSYRYPGPVYTNISIVTRECVGDSIVKGKKYDLFRFSDSSLTRIDFQLLRYDSTSGNVYENKNGADLLYDSLLCTSFTRASPGYASMFKVTSSTSSILFGKQVSSRRIDEIFGVDFYTNHTSGYAIGLMSYGYEVNDGYGEHNSLLYANIDGKEYGIDPLSVSEVQLGLPDNYVLGQNYPNPFNPSTTIQYALPSKSLVNIIVYDILGREVAILVNDYQDAGYHQTLFDDSKFASGMYIYRLQVGTFFATKKMILQK